MEPAARSGVKSLPAPLRRLWRLETGSRLGRHAELELDAILTQALELADRHGLAAVTLPRIAKPLACTPMALYRHIGNKDELLQLLRDFAIGEPPALPRANWRVALHAWTVADRQLYQRHPWLALMPIPGPPTGPNEIAWMEAALAPLAQTGLDWAAKLNILTLLGGYVRQTALLAQDMQRARRSSLRQYAKSMRLLAGAAKYPQIAALFQSGLFDAPPPATAPLPAEDPDFLAGLATLLDGVAASLPRRR